MTKSRRGVQSLVGTKCSRFKHDGYRLIVCTVSALADKTVVAIAVPGHMEPLLHVVMAGLVPIGANFGLDAAVRCSLSPLAGRAGMG